MENTQNSFTPPQAGPKKSNKLKIIIAVLVLAIIGGAGYFFIQSDLSIFQGKMGKLSNDKGPVKTEKKAADSNSDKKSAQNNPQSNQNGSSKTGINTCQTRVSNNQSCYICYDYNNVEVSRECEYVGPPLLSVSLNPASPRGSRAVWSADELGRFDICAAESIDQPVIIHDMYFQLLDGDPSHPLSIWRDALEVPFHLRNDADALLSTANLDELVAGLIGGRVHTRDIIFNLDQNISLVAGECKTVYVEVDTDRLIQQTPNDDSLRIRFYILRKPDANVIFANLPIDGNLLRY